MKLSMINLGISQLYSVQKRIKSVDFGTAEKNTLRDDLCTLIENMHNTDTSKLQVTKRPHYAKHIDTLSTWISALQKSLHFTINEETVKLVDKLCRFWLPKYDQRVLMFDDGAFAVNQVLSNDLGKTLLESDLKHTMHIYPIVIYIPYHLSEDILSNLTLYHEVGHVVVNEYCLVDFVEKDLLKAINNNWNCKLAKAYFPYVKSNIENQKIRNHIDEYIADFFASMYLGGHMLTYLEFITRNERHEDSCTHPSLVCRQKLVESVNRKDESDHFYKMIKNAIEGKCKKGDVSSMKVQIIDKSIETGNPSALSSDNELFSIYNPVWDVLEGSTDMTRKEYIWTRTGSKHDFYDKLNTAVKDTIRNY